MSEISVIESDVQVAEGSVGLQTQVGQQAVTVSAAADAAGGMEHGNLLTPDIDKELYKFESDDTPLMQLMLAAKTVDVEAPIVDHYMIDEDKATLITASDMAASSTFQAILPLNGEDQNTLAAFTTVAVKGVNGYSPDGQTELTGRWLMLFVIGLDDSTGNPIVRAVNGPKTNSTDKYCTVPAIPAGTTLIILGNAMYETQKFVDPDLIVPQPRRVYLQKRGMNSIVSDYYDSQKKQIPFSKALIAEAQIRKFKTRGNRTLWIGQPGAFKVKTPKLGTQDVYFTEGVRWQFMRELVHQGTWTIEQVIALTKMYYTGEDKPNEGIALCGKNFLEKIQCVDYSNHPEITIVEKHNPVVGWTVTRIKTVFGAIELKHEPCLDRLGLSNSAGIFCFDRLVHYRRRVEGQFEEKVEGEEATRSGTLVWDALALKGTCHIWIDGEGGDARADDSTTFVMWDSAEAPSGDDLVEGTVYILLSDCAGISDDAMQGQYWKYEDGTWSQFGGELYADNSSTEESTEEEEESGE